MPMNGYFMGLMSGTSMDGVDAALIEVHNKKRDRLIAHSHLPYPPLLKKKLFSLIENPKLSPSSFGELDKLVGEHFGKAAFHCLKKSKKKPLLIGSHGQTIFHQPEKGISLQIGRASSITAHTGITTVSNFRAMDITLGGEGAPLLPYYHRRILPLPSSGLAFHNLGGISNFTYFGPKNKILSMDTGPANCLMDMSIQQKKKLPYDLKGKFAAKGSINRALLHYLKNQKEVLDFRKKNLPKSTGRELFSHTLWKKFHAKAKQKKLSLEDELATLQEFSMELIREAYDRFILKKGLPLKKILLCGGGALNKNTLHCMKAFFPGIEIQSTEKYGFPPTKIEAMAFAFYARQSFLGEPIHIPFITGAKEKAISGDITPGKNWSILSRKRNKG